MTANIIAQFDGTCEACTEDIVGDQDEIIFCDTAGGWVHSSCDDDCGVEDYW
jgi:hypothetical protein